MFRSQICSLFFVSTSFIAFSSGAQSLEPGMWHAVTNFTVDGVALQPSIGNECISTAQTKDAKTTITSKLQGIGCTLTEWNIQGNNLVAGLSCQTKGITATGSLSGQFSEKAYHLEGHAFGFYQRIIPSVASLVLNGQWVGACTAP